MTYPVPVEAAGDLAKAVFDHANAGPTATPNVSPTLANLQAVNAACSVSGNDLTLKPGTYTRFDFTGKRLFIDTDGDYVIASPKGTVADTVDPYTFTGWLFVGLNTPSAVANVTISNGDLNGATTNLNNRLIRYTAAGKITIHRCKIYGASSTPVEIATTSTADDAISVTENWFLSPARNPSLDAGSPVGVSHCEDIAVSAGKGLIANNRMECSDGTNTAANTLTGAILAQARNILGRAVTLKVVRNIIDGFAAIFSATVFQIGNGGVGETQDTTVELVENILEAGTTGTDPGGYLVTSGTMHTIVTHSGNRDYTSGAGILGDTVSPWSNVSGSGASTLTLTSAGAGNVGAGGVGASTLTLVSSGTGAAFGPVIGAGASTLTLESAGSGSSVVGTGASTLELVSTGSGSLSGAASGTGTTSLELVSVGAGAVGVSGVGETTLTLVSGGMGSASGSSAPVRNGRSATAPGHVSRTVTAPGRAA